MDKDVGAMMNWGIWFLHMVNVHHFKLQEFPFDMKNARVAASAVISKRLGALLRELLTSEGTSDSPSSTSDQPTKNRTRPAKARKKN